MRIFSLESITAADVPALLKIIENSGLSPWTQQNFVDEIARPDSIMSVLKNEEKRPVGFIVGRVIAGNPDDSDAEAEIYNIAILHNLRRSGLGKRLLDSFRIRAEIAGVRTIWLEVRASNSSAIRFYEANGFVNHSVREGFYSNPVEDAIIMKLPI